MPTRLSEKEIPCQHRHSVIETAVHRVNAAPGCSLIYNVVVDE